MHAASLKSLDTGPFRSRLGKDPAFAIKKSDWTTPSIRSRLWKLAVTETLSLEIEAFLLLLVGILGMATLAYGMEQIFSFVHNQAAATSITIESIPR